MYLTECVWVVSLMNETDLSNAWVMKLASIRLDVHVRCKLLVTVFRRSGRVFCQWWTGVWLWCHRALSASLQCDVQVQMAFCFSGLIYTPNFSPCCWQPRAPPQWLALNNNVALSVALSAPLFIPAVPVGYEVWRKCWVGKSTDREICRQGPQELWLRFYAE